MSRLSASGSVEIESTAGVRESIVSKLKSIGFEVALIEENYIEARRGSQLIFRTKGAMLAKPNEFPIVACLAIKSNGQSSQIEVAVHEDFGVGSIFGAKKKYQQVCESALQTLLSTP